MKNGGLSADPVSPLGLRRAFWGRAAEAEWRNYEDKDGGEDEDEKAGDESKLSWL
jgi:hypothetical protein